MTGSAAVSILIAAYNEETSIARTLREVRRALPQAQIIVADDGSSDRTAEIAAALTEENIQTLRLEHGGKGHAIRHALAAATAPLCAQIDADLQFPAQELPLLIGPLERGEADLTLGTRYRFGARIEKDSIPFLKRAASWCLAWFISLCCRRRFTDVFAGFKAWRTDVLRELRLSENGFAYEAEIVVKAALAGLRISEIPVSYRRREGGESKVKVVRQALPLFARLIRMIVREALRRHRTLQNLLLAAASLLFFSLALETAARAWGPQIRDSLTRKNTVGPYLPRPGRIPPNWTNEAYVYQDPLLHHRWRPNKRWTDYGAARPFPVRTNAQGWVGEKDVSTQKAAGTLRIVYLGDSNVQGIVPERFRMPRIVERILNRDHAGPGRAFEVVNTGAASYSTYSYYIQATQILPQYAPDLVVICVDMTDVPNDEAYAPFTVFDEHRLPRAIDGTRAKPLRLSPFGRLRPTDPLPEKILAFLERHLRFVRLMRLLIQRNTHERLLFQPCWDCPANWLLHQYPPMVQANIASSMHVLEETIRALQARGIKVMVTGVPVYLQFTGQWSSQPHRIIEATAKKANAAYFNSYTAFIPFMRGKKASAYYFATDPTHLNEQGNTLWAMQQVGFMKKRGLIPK